MNRPRCEVNMIELPSDSEDKHYNCDNRARLPQRVINYLFYDRLRCVFNMIDFPSDDKFIALDLGCSKGFLTTYLASHLGIMVIGIDVEAWILRKCKKRARLVIPTSLATLECVCADIAQLPFRTDSVNLVVCASVLEHIDDLEKVLNEIKGVMSENSILVAGYPIETQLSNALLRFFLPSGWKIRDTRRWGKEEFGRSEETHKQSFRTIRRLLQAHFLMVKKKKSFSTILPDLISWYECVKMRKKT